jgi:hypothetical protein
MSHSVPDLGRYYLRGELAYPLDGLLSTSRTIFHPDDQDLVDLPQPREGLALLLSVGIDSIFHRQDDLYIGLLLLRIAVAPYL